MYYPNRAKWPLASDLHGDYVCFEGSLTIYCRARGNGPDGESRSHSSTMLEASAAHLVLASG